MPGICKDFRIIGRDELKRSVHKDIGVLLAELQYACPKVVYTPLVGQLGSGIPCRIIFMDRDPGYSRGEAGMRRVVPLDGSASIVSGFTPILC
jgi:hypothetical protein